jgi:hypothetical protein
MATLKLIKKYRCSDDCVQAGCPEHQAELQFQSTSGYYTFNNGRGSEHEFELGELEVFIELLKELSGRRADSVKI